MCREHDFNFVSMFDILPPIIETDHSQIIFNIKTHHKKCTKKTNNKISKQRILRWDASKKPLFVEKLLNAESDFVDVFEESIENSSSVDVDNLVKDFTSVIYNAAEPCFGKFVSSPSRCTINSCTPAWITENCLEARSEYNNRQDQNVV